MMPKSPYLKDGRLADIIAAITALGSYRYYSLTFAKCAERIANKPEDADRWRGIFREHPEFFRMQANETRVSLVWRRMHPKTYDTRNHTDIEPEKFRALKDKDKKRISRRPLKPSEITALINVAISLNERALEQNKASKWWVGISIGVLAFIGSLVGAWIRVKSE